MRKHTKVGHLSLKTMLEKYRKNPKKVVLKSGLFYPSLAKNVLPRDKFWQLTKWLPV